MTPFKNTCKHSFFSLICSTALMTAPLSAVANDLPDFTEEDIFIDIPQIISATHLSQKLTEAPAAVTIIDQDIIEASGALNIPDLFRLVPGMQVFHVHSNKMGVTYHGINDDFPSRMEVMINGRSIYIPLLSAVVWETIGITVDDVDYIEVVRGSNVPTHGSNAFIGAINIITKSPIAESGTSIKTTVGALGTQNYTARHSESSSELKYTISAGSIKNEGIDFYDDAGHSKFITFSGSITPNLTDTIHLDMGVTEGYAYRGEGNKEDLIEANFTPRDHKSNFQDIRWNRILDTQSEIQLRYTHNYLKLETENFNAQELFLFLDSPTLAPDIGTAALLLDDNNDLIPKDYERGTVETHEIGALYTVQPSDKINAVLGSDFRYDRAKSDVLLQNPGNDWVDEHSWQLFGNIEYKATNSLTFNTGAMFEESSIAGGAISYRLAANYATSDYSSIRAAYSNAYRMPSLLEANSAYSVNLSSAPISAFIPYHIDYHKIPHRDMEPEEINSFEVGYFHLWPEYSSQIDIRFFYEDISKALVRGKKLKEDTFDADGDLDISDNNAEWTNQGFEAQFKYQSPDAHKNSILLNYGYNESKGRWNRGYYPDEGYPNDIRIESLDDMAPMHTASLLLSTKPTPNSLVSLAHYYMDHVEWLEGYHKDSGRTNYTRTDLKLSNTFTLDTHSELELSLIVHNLFDKEYSEFYQNNIFDRRTYLQLGLTF